MAPLKNRTDDLIRDLENLHRDLLEEEEKEQSYGCIICGNNPFFIGHLEETNPDRTIIYCLCRECYEKPESGTIVKKIVCYYETVRRNNIDPSDYYGEC